MDPVGKESEGGLCVSPNTQTAVLRVDAGTRARWWRLGRVCKPVSNLPPDDVQARRGGGAPGVGVFNLARHAAPPASSAGGRGPFVGQSLSLGATVSPRRTRASTARPVRPTTPLPPGSPVEQPDWRRGLPRTVSRPSSASWAKERKVSSLPVRWSRAGPGARAFTSSWHCALRPQQIAFCSAEAFGSSPASCVTNQPEFIEGFGEKKRVVCLSFFPVMFHGSLCS